MLNYGSCWNEVCSNICMSNWCILKYLHVEFEYVEKCVCWTMILLKNLHVHKCVDRTTTSLINWWHHSYFLSSKLKIKTKNWQFNVIIVVMMIHLKNSTKKLFNFIILGKLHLKKVFLFEISYLLTKSVLVFGEESYHSIHEVYFLKMIHYGISI